MKAFIKTYEPETEFAKSKQPMIGKHKDRKSIFTYFVEYGEMKFGPFFSTKQADNFLSKQGFIMDSDDNGLFYKPHRKGDVHQQIESHYSFYN